MHHQQPKIPNDPRDAAAYWFARAHSGNFTPAEQHAFRQWRQANARHEQEYRALDEMWQATQMIPADELRSLLLAPEATTPSAVMSRRRLLIAGGAICGTVLVGGVLSAGYWPATADYQARYATGRGELRSATLPDGSRIQINTDTIAVVQYFEQRRAVQLMSGEIMLQTIADSARPFIVNTAIGQVIADAASSFNVRNDDAQVRLAVETGSAEISTGPWWRKNKLIVPAGAATSIRAGSLAPLSQIDVAAATAWRYGKLVFNDQPLDHIVREMSRYLPQPIRITDSRLNQLRMAGVFNVKDSAAFLTALRRIAPIKVTQRPDGGVDLAQSV